MNGKDQIMVWPLQDINTQSQYGLDIRRKNSSTDAPTWMEDSTESCTDCSESFTKRDSTASGAISTNCTMQDVSFGVIRHLHNPTGP